MVPKILPCFPLAFEDAGNILTRCVSRAYKKLDDYLQHKNASAACFLLPPKCLKARSISEFLILGHRPRKEFSTLHASSGTLRVGCDNSATTVNIDIKEVMLTAPRHDNLLSQRTRC